MKISSFQLMMIIIYTRDLLRPNSSKFKFQKSNITLMRHQSQLLPDLDFDVFKYTPTLTNHLLTSVTDVYG